MRFLVVIAIALGACYLIARIVVSCAQALAVTAQL